MAKQSILYPSLDTPAVLLDLDKLEANVREMSQLAARAGVRLRPHVKVHGSAEIAKMQIEAGACGIEVGSVDQAASMAEGGLEDTLVAHPFYGSHKLETFKQLLERPNLKIAVVVDMMEQAEGLSQVGQAVGRKVPVLMKIAFPGNPRFGLTPGEAVLDMAEKLCQLPDIDFVGIYGHEMGVIPTAQGADESAFAAATIMTDVAEMLKKEGIQVEHVSVGSSPTFRSTCRFIMEGKFPKITEIHPGHCVVGDIWYMRAGGNTRESCAGTVLTTVTSTSWPDWAMIDAGYKTFGADSVIGFRSDLDFFWEGRPSFGLIQGRPDLWLGRLSAESSGVFYKGAAEKLNPGDRLEIVPNNITLVINIHDQMYGVRDGRVEKVIQVTGRRGGI